MNASCIVRKPEQWKGVYPYDERDQLIHYKALLYVFYTLCVVFIAGSMIFPSLAFTQSIPSYVLSLCFSGLAILTVFVYSVAILVQYGWRGNGDK